MSPVSLYERATFVHLGDLKTKTWTTPDVIDWYIVNSYQQKTTIETADSTILLLFFAC